MTASLDYADMRAAACDHFDEKMVTLMGTMPKLTEMLLAAKASPSEYFHFLAAHYGSHPGMVAPKKLVESEKIFSHFAEWRGKSLDICRLHAKLNLEAYQVRVVERRGDPRALLRDPDMPFDAMFRWAMAAALGFFDVAMEFHEQAQAELKTMPAMPSAYSGRMRELLEGLAKEGTP